jgi:hypothetical protein|uniref:Uncharacterized protein n=1 Tax=viral metagenome TaxID=1070528 RepID=A0A6C0HFF8_9ZZZZ
MFRYLVPFLVGVYVGQEYKKLPRIKDEADKYIKEIKNYLENLK